MRKRLQREPWLTIFLTFDAVLYFPLLFWAIDTFLLWRDGAYSQVDAAFRLTGTVGGIAVLAWFDPHRGKDRQSGNRGWRRWVSWDAVTMAGLLGLLLLATNAASRKGHSFLWLACEWHKIPANFALIAALSPIAAPLISLAFLSTIWLAALGRPGRVIAIALLAVGLGYSVYATTTIGAGSRVVVYLVIYALPVLVAALALARGARRLSARATVVSLFLTLLLTHYVAHLPWSGWHRTPEAPGLEKLYPAPGEAADFPLAFLRDFVVDEERGYLFTAFGPTSGLVRLDLASRRVQIIPTKDGMVRNVLGEPGSARLRALDWVFGDLITLERDPFAIAGTLDISSGRFFVPMSFCAGGGKIYVVSTEWPGLVEVEAETDPPKVGRTIDFRSLGLTKMRSGAWGSTLWLEEQSLYMILGMVDAAGRYLLVRVDLDKFEVVGTAPIPSGGPWIAAVPEKGSVLTAGFFTDLFSEFDLRTLALKRTFHGVPNCRRAAYDPARDLIYAEGFLTGEIVALRYADAAPVRRLWIGRRALSLAFVPESDSLYLGSAEGIFRVKLSEWVGPR